MTLTADEPVTALPSGRSASSTVEAVVHARGDADALIATLRAILAGTRLPDRITVLDGSAPAAGSPGLVARSVRLLADDVPHRDGGPIVALTHQAVDPDLSARAAFNGLLGEGHDGGAHGTLLWFLDDSTLVAEGALAALVAAENRSPSTVAVGPKVLAGPDRLRSVGITATRAGRMLADPVVGERDQGQCDGRSDVLALPAAGLLIHTDTWRAFGGFPVEFGALGADLDLGWRLHRAGHRVSVIPGATIRSGPVLGSAAPVSGPERRSVRRVALARCAWFTAPFIAAWIVLTSLVAGLGLLLLKRPRAALAEWGDLGAVLTPRASVASRWRGRRVHDVSRRDLGSLFAGTGAVVRRVGDLVHEAYAPDRGAAATADAAIESGPTEAGEEAIASRSSLLGRILAGPGALAVALAAVAAAVILRPVGSLRSALVEGGLVGGELPGGRLDLASLLGTWWTGTDGAGAPAVLSPAGALLSGPAWLAERLPFADVTSPGGVALAWWLVLALPLAALSAHLAGRAVTTATWPRAVAALLWAVNPVSLVALSEGRIGALALLIGIPLVLAGLARILHPEGTMAAAGGTALVLAATAAFAPAILVPALLVLLLAVLVGGGRGRRGRALVAIVGALALLGPWTLELIAAPELLLSGPGLTAYGTTVPDLVHLLALSPDGSLGPWWWATAPVGVIAALALLRHRRSAGQWWLMLAVVGGVVAALAAARTRLDVVPDYLPDAGAAIRPWWGSGMLLAWAGICGLVAVGLADLRLRRNAGRRGHLAWPYAVTAGLLALGLGGLVAWSGLGERSPLDAWQEPRPAIAVDQASSPLSNRTLLLSAVEDGIGQRVVSAEGDLIGRDATALTTDPALATAIQAALADGTPSVEGLRAMGIAFVGARTDLADDVVLRLDATEGLVRMGSRGGYDFWRLASPATSDGTTTIGISRLTLVSEQGRVVVPTRGPAGQVRTTVEVPEGGRLVVGAPVAWARAMEVTANGTALIRTTGGDGRDRPTYELPAGRVDLVIAPQRLPQLIHVGQAFLAVALLVFAVPTGRRRRRAS